MTFRRLKNKSCPPMHHSALELIATTRCLSTTLKFSTQLKSKEMNPWQICPSTVWMQAAGQRSPLATCQIHLRKELSAEVSNASRAVFTFIYLYFMDSLDTACFVVNGNCHRLMVSATKGHTYLALKQY